MLSPISVSACLWACAGGSPWSRALPCSLELTELLWIRKVSCHLVSGQNSGWNKKEMLNRRTVIYWDDEKSPFALDWAKLVCQCGIQCHCCGHSNWWPQCRQIGQKDCSPPIMPHLYCWVSPLRVGSEYHVTWHWSCTARTSNRTSSNPKPYLPNRGEL